MSNEENPTDLPEDGGDEANANERDSKPQPERNGPSKRGDGFDLTERTARFGEAIISYAKTLPVTPVTRDMITQLVDASTSVGANYNEADEGVSKRDFRNKIGICKKEARESKFWLRMMATAVPEKKDGARPLWQEAKELHLIFAKIFRSCGS
jgi:four helix bundle protein